MKLKHLIYIICLLPFCWSCNNEDNIDEIFVSGTWNVVNYFGKANWDRRDGEPVYKKNTPEGYNALEVISTFTLTFDEDGTFKGTMQNETFEGNWLADAHGRTIQLTIKGNPANTSMLNKEFIETLKKAARYQGDSNVLILGPEDKKSFIQFRHP